MLSLKLALALLKVPEMGGFLGNNSLTRSLFALELQQLGLQLIPDPERLSAPWKKLEVLLCLVTPTKFERANYLMTEVVSISLVGTT